MNRHLRRLGALSLTAVLSIALVSPVHAARVSESTTSVKSAVAKTTVKVGARCTKLNAKAKAGSTNVICKRVNGKLIWSKVVVSADCKKAREQYAAQDKSYKDVLAQIATAKKSLEGLTGAEADGLRTQINELEKTVQTLVPVLKQFKTATDQICALS